MSDILERDTVIRTVVVKNISTFSELLDILHTYRHKRGIVIDNVDITFQYTDLETKAEYKARKEILKNTKDISK
jgi:hypothetical protein